MKKGNLKKRFRRWMKSAAAVMLAACLLPMPVQAAGSTSSDNGDGTFTNPVIYSDVPDLDVIRVEDNYYMVSTTMHLSPRHADHEIQGSGKLGNRKLLL